MEKLSFSNEGFQQLQKKLYQLPDSLLEIQANLVSTSFKEWMIKNFSLSNDQIAFIETQNLKMIRLLATQTGIAIANRLPITLIKPLVKPEKQLLDSKLIRPESNFSVSFLSHGKIGISGYLKIHISYLSKHYPNTSSNVFLKHNQPIINQLF